MRMGVLITTFLGISQKLSLMGLERQGAPGACTRGGLEEVGSVERCGVGRTKPSWNLDG